MKLSKKHSIYAISLSSFLLIGLALFINTNNDKPLANKTAPTITEEKTVPKIEPLQVAEPAFQFQAKKRAVPIAKALEKNYLENPFSGQETKARLIQISDGFAEDIQHPTTSKPIRDEVALQKYLPNQSVASSIAISPKIENSPEVSIKSSKHQYFMGESITAIAQVHGLTAEQNISVSGRLIQNGKQITTAMITPLAQDPHQFELNFHSLDNLELNSANLARVVASFQLGSQHIEIGTAINYVSAVASVDHIAAAQVENEYLSIPIYITTSSPGYHQVSGILYKADSKQALLSLSAEKELLTNYDAIPLKAHIAALKSMGHEGPYVLKDVTLTRMPSKPKFTTEYGTVSQDSFNIEGFPFSDYQDVPYVDEQAQARLEFLTQLGSSQ